MDMAKNYKDNVQDDYKIFAATLDQAHTAGGLKAVALSDCEKNCEEYGEKLKGYTRKDQKPYWHG